VDAVLVKAANIGLYNCPHLGRLKVVIQTGAGTCILVLVVVVPAAAARNIQALASTV